MKKKYLVIVLLAQSMFSQAPAIEWQKCLGGTKSEDAKKIQQTSDGGYIVAGYTVSTDGDASGVHVNGTNSDAWVVKLSSSGAMEWQKPLGGTGVDIANAVQQTTDGGFIVVGSTNSNDGDVVGMHVLSTRNDAWAVKLSSAGVIEWQRALGGTGVDEGNDVRQTTDGGFIVVGSSNSNDGDLTGSTVANDAWVVKLSNLGAIEWQQVYGGTNLEQAYSIQQTTDGGYIMAGSATSNDGYVIGNHGAFDAWAVKLTGNGTIEWQKQYGGASLDQAYSIQQTTDGGYIMAGSAMSSNGEVIGNHGVTDCWILKLSNVGAIEWQNALGGTNQDYANSIQQTIDGGFCIAGVAGSIDGDLTGHSGLQSADYWVVKLSNTGSIQWQKTIGGTSYDIPGSILQTADNGFVIAGYTLSNNGDVTAYHGGQDAWVVKLGPDALATTSFTIHQIKVVPNPTTGILTLHNETNSVFDKISITDTTGKVILEQTQNTNQVNVESLANGIYFLHAFSREEKFTIKFVKQ